jgi:hypothetical protein
LRRLAATERSRSRRLQTWKHAPMEASNPVVEKVVAEIAGGQIARFETDQA